jgi:hypothetical protein
LSQTIKGKGSKIQNKKVEMKYSRKRKENFDKEPLQQEGINEE